MAKRNLALIAVALAVFITLLIWAAFVL